MWRFYTVLMRRLECEVILAHSSCDLFLVTWRAMIGQLYRLVASFERAVYTSGHIHRHYRVHMYASALCANRLDLRGSRMGCSCESLGNFSAHVEFYRTKKWNVYGILGTSRWGSAGRTSVGRHENVSSREHAFYGESNKLKNAPKSAVFRYENVSFV